MSGGGAAVVIATAWLACSLEPLALRCVRALAFALLYHAVNTAVSLLLGAVGLWSLGLRLLPLLKGVYVAAPEDPQAS